MKHLMLKYQELIYKNGVFIFRYRTLKGTLKTLAILKLHIS